jgi:hypothetical protein
MLYKNFGVTRHGRVVFYDYDEIEYLTDCVFRDIPQARNEEDEMAAEPWYPIGKHDVFPEQFGTLPAREPEDPHYLHAAPRRPADARLVAVAQGAHPGRHRRRRLPVSAADPFLTIDHHPGGH